MFIASFNACIIQARIGCMDKSAHLAEAYDTKNYYYVACNHNCKTLTWPLNRCPECQHFHEAEIFTVVDPSEQPKDAPQKAPISRYNTDHIMRNLALTYRQKQAKK